MKNILLLTDLSLSSLWPLHAVVKEQATQPITIHVVHMLDIPTSITDLLSLKSRRPYASLSAQFNEALQLLRKKYSRQIEAIHFRFLYGNNSRILNNFIEANNIACTYVTTSSNLIVTDGRADFLPLLKGCKVPVHQAPLRSEVEPSYQGLSVLLETETPIVKTTKPSFSYS